MFDVNVYKYIEKKISLKKDPKLVLMCLFSHHKSHFLHTPKYTFHHFREKFFFSCWTRYRWCQVLKGLKLCSSRGWIVNHWLFSKFKFWEFMVSLGEKCMCAQVLTSLNVNSTENYKQFTSSLIKGLTYFHYTKNLHSFHPRDLDMNKVSEQHYCSFILS